MGRMIDHVVHPFARGALTSDGVQYSTLVTVTNATSWDAIETVEVKPPFELADVLEYEFGLTCSVQSEGTTAGLDFKWQARNFGDDTWVDLNAAEAVTADASSLAEYTFSGYVAAQTNLNQPNIEVRLVVQDNASTDYAAGKTKNESYVRIIYKS